MQLARIEPPADPWRSELPTILHNHKLNNTAWRRKAKVLHTTNPNKWRQLHESLGDTSKKLTNNFADFGRETVVAIGTGRARAWPKLRLDMSTEEGVDVLTVTEVSPSGEDPGERAPVVLLKLARRPRQLSAVLFRVCGPAPGSEEVLGILPPLR